MTLILTSFSDVRDLPRAVHKIRFGDEAGGVCRASSEVACIDNARDGDKWRARELLCNIFRIKRLQVRHCGY